MRRIAVVLVLLLAGTVWPAADGLADRSSTAQAVDGLQADFNNDGFADLAVGVAGENLGATGNAGAVNVLYGTASGLTGTGSRLFTQDSPGVGSSAGREDDFGWTIAAGDFDGEGFADLAVGVWLENVGAAANGGAVNVLYGTAGGLTGSGSQFFTQDSPGVPGVVEPDDEVGFALGAGDFNRDRFVDLAVGAPGEDYGAADRGGAVNVLPGSAGGLTGTGSQLFTQNSPGVPDSVEFDDFFGDALAASGPQGSTAAATSPPSHSRLRRTVAGR